MQYPHRIIPHGHEPSDEAPLGLIIAIPIFLCINIVLAIIGARWMNRLSHDSSEDVLTAHYLGGRSFGPWLSLGTMFASLFSGFTVIGIPNGAYYHGWIELERIAYVSMVTFVASGAAVRLRKASLVRNHQTPSDFISDMFQSQLLRYAIIVIQLLSQFIWMTSNVLAVRNAFNGAFKLDPDSPWFTIGVITFILLSEWFGGLSAVALTDSVQGVIMLFGTVSVTCVIKYYWGGWVALDPSTFPSPEFYQTPTKNQQWIWWQLCFLTISQAFYPVTIQRYYSASSLEGVRMGVLAMFAGPWIATIGSIFIGTMGVQILGESCSTLPDSEQEACLNPSSPFAAILEQLMLIGGFPEVAAVILYTSALAAIMSTTDSVLISISQIITSDIVYPMRPSATPKQIMWAGRFVSLAISILALVMGLLWKGSIILLFDLSMPISMQLVPAFLIGLYSKYRPHPWSIAIPTWGAIIAAVFITIFWEHDALHDAVFVFLMNCGAILLCELGRLIWNRKLRFNMAVLRNLNNTKDKAKSELDGEEQDHQDPFPNRPKWDKAKVSRFGDNSLSPKLLDKMMIGMKEPIKNYQYVLLMFVAVTITVPLTPESLPLLENGVFVVIPATFRGLPWWAFKAIILIFVSSLLTLPIIFEMPKDYPFDKSALLKSGIEADIVELEPEEKGGRTMFDEVNQELKNRRQMIREQTTRIKTIKKDAYDYAEQKRLADESSKSATGHLDTLVKVPTRRTTSLMGLFESQWKLKQTNEGKNEDNGDDEKEVNFDVEGKLGDDEFVDNEVEKSIGA